MKKALLSLLAFAGSLSGAMFEPASGPPGTEVDVTLAGLDATAVTAVAFGGTAATIVSKSGETVRVTVPAGARSGPVTLGLGGGERVTPLSFEVTRRIPLTVPGRFTGVDRAGSLFGPAVGGEVEVAVGRSTLVFASAGEEGPPLLGIVTDGDAALTLDGASTAKTCLFLSYLIYSADSGDAAAILAKLDTLPEVAALATHLDT